MKIVTALLLAVTLTCASAAPAEEMSSHPAPEKLGRVIFPTSCSATESHAFERAVALLHSFAYTAAEQAFQHVAAADPSCAMAQWGMAMSHFHQLWGPPDAEELAKGEAEASLATGLGAKTERERLLIAAMAAYYDDAAHVPPPARAKAYATAMASAARRYPADTEVQVFYALSLLATASPQDKTHANQKRAGAILESIWRKFPDHPGAAHYLIHAYDSAELASRGLAPARAYAKIAPSAPHALHMPSHIFTRLGLRHRMPCICHRTSSPGWACGTTPSRRTWQRVRQRTARVIWAKSCMRWTTSPTPTSSAAGVPMRNKWCSPSMA